MGASVRWAGFIGLLGMVIVTGTQFLRADEIIPQQLPAAQEPALQSTGQSSTTDGLPLGIPCHIHSICAGIRETQLGKILRITPEWVVLDPQQERPPIVRKLPYIGRLYKNTYETLPTGEGEVWIPRATIHKIVVHRPESISFSFNRVKQGADVEKTSQARTKTLQALEKPRREPIRMLVPGSGPTVTPTEGAIMPTAYYLRDDVQYFPHGPEFKLKDAPEAIKEYQRTHKKSVESQK